MLSNQEFEYILSNMDLELKTSIVRQNEFISSLSESIIALSILFYPEIESYKSLYIEPLTQKVRHRVWEINELLDKSLYGMTNDEETNPNDYKIPPRDVSQSEKQWLADTLKNMLPEQHEYFIKLNGQRVKNEAEEREFLFQCHDKSKEMLWRHFPEIVDLPANSIRRLNFSSFFTMYEYTYDFYYCAGDYINEKELI